MSIPKAFRWRRLLPSRRAALALCAGSSLISVLWLARQHAAPEVAHSALTLTRAEPASTTQPLAAIADANRAAANEAAALCLAPAAGNDSLSARLARGRALAQARAERPETWLELGQAWLRQAQRSSDSGYM